MENKDRELNSAEKVAVEELQKLSKLFNSIIQRYTDKYTGFIIYTDNARFDFNMKSWDEPDNTYIARLHIDYSLLRRVFDVLYIAFSSHHVFPKIGRFSNSFRVIPFELGVLHFEMAIENNERPLFDKKREGLLSYAYDFCMHFLLAHEAYHFLNGHLFYMSANNLAGFGKNSENCLSSLDSQTLEMDADCCAVCDAFGTALFNFKFNSYPNFFDNYEDFFNLISFSIHLLVLGTPSKPLGDVKDLKKMGYVSQTMRLHIIFSTMYTFMTKKGISNEILHVFLDSLDWSRKRIFKLATSGYIIIENLIDDYTTTYSQDGNVALIQVYKNWDLWIEKLTPHTFCKLSPPWDG